MTEPTCGHDPRQFRKLHAKDGWTVLGSWCPECGSGALADTAVQRATQRMVVATAQYIRDKAEEERRAAAPVAPRRRRVKREEPVQQAIVAALELRGYSVWTTSRQHCRCADCGSFRRTKGDGVTRGLPDLLVWRDEWPSDRMVALEVKGPSTALSPEQVELVRIGRVRIVRSVRDALEAVSCQQ